MFRWNTDQIADDVRMLSFVKSVTIDEPGGDVDTDNLVVEIDGSEDHLFVAGFSVDFELKNTSNVDVEMIELSDGMDSSGGLSSSDNNTAQAYIAVRQYFVDKNAAIVNSMKDYF